MIWTRCPRTGPGVEVSDQYKWRKVQQSLKNNPDDKLIIEGYPVFDQRIGEHGTMTVFVQSATTKLLQQVQREKQKPAVSR